MASLRVDQEVLRRLPLAESVLLLLRQATLPEHSLDLFERWRDRCYTRTLGFDLFVGLIRDALLSYGGSGRQAFEQARWHGTLEVSNQAVYGKLGCVPIALSEAFLAENTQRLLPLLPGTRPASVPASLRRFRVLTVDGKVTKRVTKRLKVLRGLSGGALGGKGLACLDMNSGLVIALAGCADGDANDCSLVAALMAGVTPLLDPEQECLIVADAQFADLTQPQRFLKLVPGGRSHFLLRYSAKTQFTPDPAARPAGAEALLSGQRRTRAALATGVGLAGAAGQPQAAGRAPRDPGASRGEGRGRADGPAGPDGVSRRGLAGMLSEPGPDRRRVPENHGGVQPEASDRQPTKGDGVAVVVLPAAVQLDPGGACLRGAGAGTDP